MVMHILRQFSSIGRITRYHIPKEGTNWIYVQFENHLQVKSFPFCRKINPFRRKERVKNTETWSWDAWLAWRNVSMKILTTHRTKSRAIIRLQWHQKGINADFLWITSSCSFSGSVNSSLNSSTSFRFAGMRDSSVLSPYNQRKRVLDPVSGLLI